MYRFVKHKIQSTKYIHLVVLSRKHNGKTSSKKCEFLTARELR